MESIGDKLRKIEDLIRKTESRIESLKTEFNLFFSGERKIPPEKERVNIEKVIREMQSHDHRSGKIEFLLQNLSSRFYLYNNLWLKKLNQLESGLISKPSKTQIYENSPAQKKNVDKTTVVSLNNESSFDSFYNDYDQMVKNNKGNVKKKEELINSIKLKMISENIIDANINLSVTNGKVQIKIKK